MRIKEPTLIAILIIFYLVGTVGILIPAYKNSFLALSFFNLILSFVLMLFARRKQFLPFLLFLIVCFIVGIGVEWIGIHTGYLFGEYSYGKNLGAKFFGVPWVIGLNWGLLIVTSASIVNKFNTSVYIKAVLAALLMTGLDYLMEPVAVESNFWTWKNGSIPMYNYVCWFFVSLPLQLLYFKFKLAETNKVFSTLFLILALFFILLTLF
jgi:putative membrane protein